jgi:hypothetical protein
VPLRTGALAPVPDPALRPGVELPAHLVALAWSVATRLEPA